MKRIQVMVEVGTLDRIAAYCKESGISRSDYLRLRLAVLITTIEAGVEVTLRGAVVGAHRPVPIEVAKHLYEDMACLVATGKAGSLAALVRTAAEMTLEPAKEEA